MSPLVSLVVPVYNVELYIEKCLISLVRQTYRNIEIIVVNDGSTDGSIDVAKKLSEKDKRIRIINQFNQGLGKARNTGINNSTGKFIAFIDSDDWIEERMVEELVNAARYSDADIVCCGYNQIVNNIPRPRLPDPVLNKERDYLTLCFNDVRNNVKKITTTAWAKLFKSSLLKDNTILFSLRYFEDTPFFIEAIYYSSRIYFVEEPLYNYVFRNGSATNSGISAIKLDCFYKADDLILGFLIEKGLYEFYEKCFSLFHFLRILYYGGCMTLWENRADNKLDDYLCFFKYLNPQRSFLTRFESDDLTSFEKQALRTLRTAISLADDIENCILHASRMISG